MNLTLIFPPDEQILDQKISYIHHVIDTLNYAFQVYDYPSLRELVSIFFYSNSRYSWHNFLLCHSFSPFKYSKSPWNPNSRIFPSCNSPSSSYYPYAYFSQLSSYQDYYSIPNPLLNSSLFFQYWTLFSFIFCWHFLAFFLFVQRNGSSFADLWLFLMVTSISLKLTFNFWRSCSYLWKSTNIWYTHFCSCILYSLYYSFWCTNIKQCIQTYSSILVLPVFWSSSFTSWED